MTRAESPITRAESPITRAENPITRAENPITRESVVRIDSPAVRSAANGPT